MNDDLKSLFSILKILVSFSFILFFVSIYFLFIHDAPISSKPESSITNTQPDDTSEHDFLVKGQKLFEENCKTCHAVHSRKIGPALKDVTTKRSKNWIRSFIRNPEKMIKA